MPNPSPQTAPTRKASIDAGVWKVERVTGFPVTQPRYRIGGLSESPLFPRAHTVVNGGILGRRS
jgi:hypothetical protein